MTDSIINFLNYFFEFSPPRNFNYQYAFWTIIGLTIALAIFIIVKIKKSPDKILKKLLKEYPSKLVTIAVLLAINVLSRINRIDILSMRFLTYILTFWLAYTVYQLYLDIFKKYPQQIQKQPKEEIAAIKYKIHKNKRPKHRQR